MEIAELILMLRNEVQRSYDLIEDSMTDSGSADVYINIEKMEIELPITYSESEKEVLVKDLKKNSRILQRYNLPFDPKAIEKKDKEKLLSDMKASKIKGKTISISVVNQNDKKDAALSAQQIGRIKIVLHPIVK